MSKDVNSDHLPRDLSHTPWKLYLVLLLLLRVKLMVKMNARNYCFMRLYLLVFLVYIHVLNGIIQVTGHKLKARSKSWTNKKGQLQVKKQETRWGWHSKSWFSYRARWKSNQTRCPMVREIHENMVIGSTENISSTVIPKQHYTNHMKSLKLCIFESSYLSCPLYNQIYPKYLDCIPSRKSFKNVQALSLTFQSLCHCQFPAWQLYFLSGCSRNS